MLSPNRKKTRAKKRWRRVVGKTLGWFFAALLGLVVVALLGVNLPFSRRLIAKEVTTVLADVVTGKIVIDEIGRVGLTGVRGVRVRLTDEKGKTLITASGVSGSLHTYGLVKSLLGKSGIEVHLDAASIDHVDALLDADKDGNLLLVKALSPPPPPPNKPPEPASPSTLRLTIDEARLASAWTHGQPSPGFLVDAELHAMSLGVALSGGTTALDLRSLQVATRAMPDGANVNGNFVAHAELPPSPRKPSVKGNFHGTVGEVQANAEGSLVNDLVTAHVDADAAPRALTALVPTLELRNPAHVNIDASGTMPNVHAKGEIRTGPAVVNLTADAALGTPLHGHLELGAEHIDLAAVLKGAPESDLNAEVRANGSLQNGKATGNFDVQTRPATIAGEALPALNLKGRLAGSKGEVALEVAEPGTKTHITADLNLAKMEVGYDASVSIPDFTRFKRLPAGSSGSASVRVRGIAYLTTSTFSADVQASVANVQSGGVKARKADVSALLTGPFTNFDIDATITGQGLVAAGRTFDAATVSAKGNQSGAGIAATLRGAPGTPDVDVTTNVTMDGGVKLKAVQARVGKGEYRIRARIASLGFGGGVIQADGITVDGAGADISGAARIAPEAMDIRAISAGFEVGPAARALGVTDKSVRGRLAMDVDMKTRGNSARGKLGVELTDGAYAGVSGIALRMATSVEGRRFTGQVNAKVEGGHIDVDAQDLTLGGSVFTPHAWTHAFGHVKVDSNVDLARIAKVLPTSMLPFDDMAGKVALSGELTRGPKDASPETTWTVHTEGFRASAKSKGQPPHDGTEVRAPAAWHVAGVDLDGSLSIAKERGSTKLNAEFRDSSGLLAEVDASADLPYLEVLDDPASSAKTLESVPFHFRFAMPRRRISKLPPMLATAGIDGEVEMTLEASDTAREPTVKFTSKLYQLVARGRRKGIPIDVRLDAGYGEGLGKLDVEVDCKKADALVLHSEMRAKVSDFMAGNGAKAPWDASVKGKFDGFPLDAISLVGGRRIKGSLSGDLDAATGAHTKPHAEVKLGAEGLGLGRASHAGGAKSRATVTANVDDHSMNAKVRFDQPDGFLEATASAGLGWTTPVSPTFDPSKGAAKAAASASKFRIAVLGPFVSGILSDLDGRVDADAHLEATTLHGAPKLDGTVVLDQASFELASAGQEFHDVHAKVVLRQDGTLRADDVHANGLTGTIKATGVATLDGLNLKRAELTANVPSSDPFPVTIQGQSLARASGTFKLLAVPSADEKSINVTVDVPTAKVEMLDKPTHELQPLDHDEHVRVGYHRTPEEFVVVPLERPSKPSTDGPPTTIVAAVKLGDVEITRGTDLRVRLEGTPKIVAGATTEMSGDIHLRSGYIYVQGKKFEIESGTISFVGAPDNPNVVVTAGWTAPEGTRVYADFVGPLKTGKVTLRSEPAHTKSEILSLILFGTADGGGAGSSSSPAGTAAGVAGGVATQGLNKALDDVTGLDITTRIDTSDSANPRPELEVRVARDVSVAVAHVLGVPPPGTNPDHNLAKIDWRFLRNWSLVTTVGDEGSSMLDMVWQYRY